jgi:hypothetical protein
MRLPGRWVLLGLYTAVAGVVVGLVVSGAPLSWSAGGRALPPARARVSYLAVTGPATAAQAEPFAGSLLVGGCKVVVAAGAAERSAALAEAARFSSVRFVVTGAAAGNPPNVTALVFTPAGLRAGVASAVTAAVRAEGG